MGFVLDKIVRLYGLPNRKDTGAVDVIIPLGYASLNDEKGERLANGTRRTLFEAIGYQKSNSPNAVIVFSNCSYLFPASERRLKEKIVLDLKVPKSAYIDAGLIENTVTEAWANARAIREAGMRLKRALVICSASHARSARLIYRDPSVFGSEVEVLIRSIPDSAVVEFDHPIILTRGGWKWLFANVLRHAALRILGIERVGKVQHPVKE